MRFSGSQKFRQIFDPMLTIRIHRNRVSKTVDRSLFESGSQSRAFAGILFEPDNFAFRQLRQWDS
jgi:hypothetical protein